MSCLLVTVASAARATEQLYHVDPEHTYPSFEADHMGGLSVWRGKFNRSSGTVTLDLDKQTGSVDIVVDTSSIDFGNDALNEHAQGAEMFAVDKYPTAHYTGRLDAFVDGAPTRVQGELTLRGVTQPLELQITKFQCKTHPMAHKPVCGADATATFKRDSYGLDYGVAWGFDQTVTLRIQIEALAE
ncbi:MAG: YceI family protein [Steroidobacteraceae bacterium]